MEGGAALYGFMCHDVKKNCIYILIYYYDIRSVYIYMYRIRCVQCAYYIHNIIPIIYIYTYVYILISDAEMYRNAITV